MNGVLYFTFLLLAPIVGSFLGVLVVRLPDNRPVLLARSQCDHCGHLLAPRDLVPLASWLFAKGKCRYCKQPIGWFAPAVELAAIVVVLWAATAVDDGNTFVATCIFGWTLLALGIIDARRFLLPDSFCIVLAATGLVATCVLMRADLLDHLIGGIAGSLFFVALTFGYRWLRGREGLGLGDAKLMGAIGLWLGWQALPTVVLLAAVLGLGVALLMPLAGKRIAFSMRLPLGTFLAAAAWIVWLYGPLVPA